MTATASKRNRHNRPQPPKPLQVVSLSGEPGSDAEQQTADGFLFTPTVQMSGLEMNKGARVLLRLTAGDRAKIGRGQWAAVVADQLTGRRFKVKGWPCSFARCYCDAAIVAEL